MKKHYENYESWENDSQKIGWVHVHDDLVVCDDPDSGECLGEWCDEDSGGFLLIIE